MVADPDAEPKEGMAAVAPARARGIGGLIDYAWFLGCYLIFAGLGALVSLICLPVSYLWSGPAARRFGQRVIHRLFVFYVWYLQLRRLILVDVRELQRLRGRGGLIIAANHPCLMDVIFVNSQLPNVFCIMKHSLRTNLILCGTARLAGYVDNQSPRKMIEQCRARLEEGGNFLIFPEGTRTVEPGVNPFKMGFALTAKMAHAPVQTLFIETKSAVLGKGWPLLRWPFAPAIYTLRLGREFVFTPETNVKVFGKSIEDYFRERLVSPATRPARRRG